MVGAYLTAFKDGLTRDQLSEALGWTLQRVEQALAALDAALEDVGMRSPATPTGLVIVARFERTNPDARLGLERLTAPELGQKLGAFGTRSAARVTS